MMILSFEKSKNTFKLMLFAIFILFAHTAIASDLFIKYKNKEIKFTKAKLLKHKDLEILNFQNGTPVLKGKSIAFSAIPLHKLFETIKLKKEETLIFKCSDGFSAPMDTKMFLNASKKNSMAYLAIEDDKKPWPLIPGKNTSAGPYYIIWKKPELSKVKQEQWPFKVVGFEIKESFNNLYKSIIPHKKSDLPALAGFKVFKNNCFVCHTMNGIGESNLGPDLNIPLNPTEYFQKGIIKKLIRNPQSVRKWEKSLMSSFSKDEISDEEIDHLISYLKYMSKRKQL
jgi:mono/diheme cytochrome c family protein